MADSGAEMPNLLRTLNKLFCGLWFPCHPGNIFVLLKSTNKIKIWQKRPQSVEQLKSNIEQEWDNISLAKLQQLISSIPEHLQNVVKSVCVVFSWLIQKLPCNWDFMYVQYMCMYVYDNVHESCLILDNNDDECCKYCFSHSWRFIYCLVKFFQWEDVLHL